MATTFKDFDARPSADKANDYLVGYYKDPGTGTETEGRWKFEDLTNTLVTVDATFGERYKIKKFADGVLNAYYQGSAITESEEVIFWGNMDTSVLGSGLGASDTDPGNPISYPFLDGPDNSYLLSRRQQRNFLEEGKKIIKLYFTWYSATALIDDGTLWHRGYAHTGHAHGWSSAELTPNIGHALSAFYRITNWDWTQPSGDPRNKIVDVKHMSVGGGDWNCTVMCLDGNGDVHMFGYMNPQWGTAITLFTPVNLTKGHASLQGNVKDFCVTGNNGNRVARVITNSGELWSFGYNGHGQLADGTTTARTSWVQSKTASGNVTDADFFFEQLNDHYLNHGYISKVVGGVNRLYFSGWENDTYGLKSVASTNNVYEVPAGGTCPVGDPWIQGIIQGRQAYPTGLALTNSGRVFSAGTNSYGEAGRMNGSASNLGPTFAEVDMYNPATGTVSTFAHASHNIKAKKLISDESTGANCTAVIAESPTGHKYAFLTGYYAVADLTPYTVNTFVFAPVNIKESVEDVLLYGDRTNHRYSMFLCDTGAVYGLGYSSGGTLKTQNGWTAVPVRIF